MAMRAKSILPGCIHHKTPALLADASGEYPHTGAMQEPESRFHPILSCQRYATGGANAVHFVSVHHSADGACS
jgi:hypothetical protein